MLGYVWVPCVTLGYGRVGYTVLGEVILGEIMLR